MITRHISAAPSKLTSKRHLTIPFGAISQSHILCLPNGNMPSRHLSKMGHTEKCIVTQWHTIITHTMVIQWQHAKPALLEMGQIEKCVVNEFLSKMSKWALSQYIGNKWILFYIRKFGLQSRHNFSINKIKIVIYFKSGSDFNKRGHAARLKQRIN